MKLPPDPWEVAKAEVRLTPWYFAKHPMTWGTPLVVLASGGLLMFVLHVVGAPVQAYYSLGGVSLVLAAAVSYRTTINRLLHDRLCVFLGVLQEAVPATFKETILHQMSSCGMGDISEALEQRFGELPAREEVLARLGGAILIWDVDVDIARAIWRRWINDPTDPDGIPHRCERCYGKVVLPPQCCPQGLQGIIRYYAGPCVSGDTTEIQHRFETVLRQQQLAAYL